MQDIEGRKAETHRHKKNIEKKRDGLAMSIDSERVTVLGEKERQKEKIREGEKEAKGEKERRK